MDTISVDLNKELVELLDQLEQPVRETVQELVVLELYRRGAISIGKGADLLHMTLLEFIQYTGEQGIPYFKLTPEELDAELERLNTL
jgi:predicted HTH domain antitoxin